MSDFRPKRTRDRARSGWGLTGAALLVTLLAADSLRSVLQGETWWLLGGVLAAASLGATVLARLALAGTPRLRRFAPLAGLVVLAAGAILIWAPGTLAWGLIPTPETARALGGTIRQASEQIYSDSVPASNTPAIRLLVAPGIALLALLIDALVVGARLPWVAGVPLLLLAIVPRRALRVGDDLLGVALTALAFLFLVWLERRRDLTSPTAGSAAALAGTAVIGALLAQAFVPALVDRTPASASTLAPVFVRGVDPLVRLGDQLRRGADVPVLTYTTTATTPVYLRVVTIDDLTGNEWAPTESDRDSDRTVTVLPAPVGLEDPVQREEVTTTVDDTYAQRQWLPLPYPASGIDGLAAGWRADPASLTVEAPGRSATAGEYTVTSLQVEPTEQQLRDAGTGVPAGFDRYVALPESTPALIGTTARSIVSDAGATTAYDQAVALQDYLRGGDFTYDENTPEADDGDGDSMDVVATFLDEKSGYCVHFAAAMTVMARELGIPARIVVGYQPGDRVAGKANTFEVTSHDLHSWPELYFPGAGWTRFEPTPGRGDVPDRESGIDAPTASAAPTPTPTASAASQAPREREDTAAAATSTGGGPPLGGPLVTGGVVLVLLVPAAVRALRRRRRLAALENGHASPAWDELLDTAVDLGLTEERAATPRSLAGRLEQSLPQDGASRDELRALLAVVERERFARGGSVDGDGVDGRSVGRLLAELAASRSRRDRVRAVLAPKSLFGKLTRSRLA